MKNFILSFFLLASSAVCMAQINLREGIVITLQGDTLHGSIDYRTDQLNAEQCLFFPDRKNESVTYKPGDIAGYRFLDNGRYYVSRVVEIEENKQKNVFLEYVVRGNLSLYYLDHPAIVDKLYFLEDETGKMVKFRYLGMDQKHSLRNKNLTDAFMMTRKSEKAQQILWRKEPNRINTTKAVLTYNKEVCPDGQCEVMEYKKKRKPSEDNMFKFGFKAGYATYNMKVGRDYVVDKYNAGAHFADFKLPYLSVGCVYYISRLAKNFFGEAFLAYYHFSGTYIYDDGYTKPNTIFKYKETDLTGKIGFGYHWKNINYVQPRVRGGAALSFLWGDCVKENMSFCDNIKCTLHPGYYAGAGVLFPIGKHAITLDVDYNLSDYYKSNIKRTIFAIGYQF